MLSPVCILSMVLSKMTKVMDLKVGDFVRISKFKAFLAKVYTPDWSDISCY